MEITEVFYPQNRQEWRNWLEENYEVKLEIWVQKYRKATGRPSIAYDDLVEECLCFGWIDGVVKKNCEEGSVQRITPRRKKSFLSELNRQRVWKLQSLGLMKPAGLKAIEGKIGSINDPFEIPDWVLEQLKGDKEVWQNFQGFSKYYRRLKVGWITEPGRSRREVSQKRLDYLIKMTKQGKMYGTVPIVDKKIQLDN